MPPDTSPTGANVTIINSKGESKALRPAPFVSISVSPLRNKNAYFGNRYNITLNGTIVANNTSVRLDAPMAPVGMNSGEDGLSDIMSMQKDLVDFFDIEPNATATSVARLEITPGGNNPKIGFNVRFESISFEEGTYVSTCKYTISFVSEKESNESASQANDQPEDLLEDFNESWSFEVDNNYAYAETVGNSRLSSRSFIATRTITATGRNSPTRTLKQSTTDALTDDAPDSAPYDKPAWMQAMGFIENYANPEATTNASKITDLLLYDRSKLGTFLDSSYEPFNHSRTSSIDKGAGTVTVTDSWVLAKSSDQALENYTSSVSTSRDNPYVKVSIQGSIKGLAPKAFTDSQFALNTTNTDSPFSKARSHYNSISNNGNFGVGCAIFKRADNVVAQSLNSQPLSVSLGTNEITGEITYNLEFDNRPSNYFTNVLFENISVNDTYPGDVFATIPVLGRPTGPILQFTFGRTEYKRDISIEIVLDYTDLGYGTDRNALLLRKPSINEPIAGQLKSLIGILSPANEPGIRKYFVSPPTESWNPKEGRYTLSIGWTYELSE
jgi:hypothetical protein